MLAGNILLFPTSWFSKGEPLSALIALELGTSVTGSVHYQASFAAGLVLLAFVMGINLLINILMHYKGNGAHKNGG
jgi:phosphate transport system permease protein